MKKSIIAILVATVTFCTAWAQTISKTEQLDCANGFADAYLITDIDALVGCILSQHGIGCDGQPFRHDFTIQVRPSDLIAPFDYLYSGVTVAGTWYVKIDYDNGQFVRAWGKKADGSYYEAKL